MALTKTAITYNQMLEIIKKNLGDDAWYQIEAEGLQAKDFDKFLQYCKQAGVNVTYDNTSNSILGYSVNRYVDTVNTTGKIGETLNSNTLGATAAQNSTAYFSGASAVTTTATETADDVITASSNLTKYSGGSIGSLAANVIGKIGTGLMIGSAAVQLGKTIDSSIYHIGKALGANPPEELNPDTWNSIIEKLPDGTAGDLTKWAFRTILGINDDGSANMYIDEDALAYAALWMKEQGYFNKAGIELQAINVEGVSIPKTTLYRTTTALSQECTNISWAPSGRVYTTGEVFTRHNPTKVNPTYGHYFVGSPISNDAILYTTVNLNVTLSTGSYSYKEFIAVRENTLDQSGYTMGMVRRSTVWDSTTGYTDSIINTWSGITIKPYQNKTVQAATWDVTPSSTASYTSGILPTAQSTVESSLDESSSVSYIAWAMLYGDTVSTEGAPAGITDQSGAVLPDLSGVTTPEEAKQVLKNTYPNLWDNRIEEQSLQPDGTTKTRTYVPSPMPTKGSGKGEDTIVDTQGSKQFEPSRDLETNPHPTITGDISPETSTDSQLATTIQIVTTPQTTTQTNPQTGEETQVQTDPQEMVEELPSEEVQPNPLNPAATTNPTPTGTGDTPVIVTPSSVPGSLYAIYNPSLTQLNNFASWLWSDNFVDQIKKIFSDPMQAIIGLHKIYVTPVKGVTQNIQVGYLDSGVSSTTVSNQYVTVDCGYVNLLEYFGNVFDYSPYTDVKLYLPFIGIVRLDVADIMRSTITVTYNVDVLTGACLAMVSVQRDNAGGVLYQYAGNAAETLPISSGSYMGIVASLASLAGGVATTLASGGGALPMVMGVAGSLMNAHTTVEHSGGFSGNAGALGVKIPYLIISRPQTELANNYQYYVGKPANTTTTLSACSGYVQVTECHLENIDATQSELTEIENLLKSGVLI